MREIAFKFSCVVRRWLRVWSLIWIAGFTNIFDHRVVAILVCRVGDHLDPAVWKRDVILSCCDVGVTGLSVTKVVVVVVPYRILPVVLNLTFGVVG